MKFRTGCTVVYVTRSIYCTDTYHYKALATQKYRVLQTGNKNKHIYLTQDVWKQSMLS